MGSVYRARFYIQEAYNIMRRSSRDFTGARDVKTFTRSTGLIELQEKDVLVMHIIDDLNCVFCDWVSAMVRRLQIMYDAVCQRNGIPVKRSKSTP